MKHKLVKVMISKLLIACLVFSSLSVAFGAATTAKSDIKGHWAESQITAWIDKGWIKGYTDGSFKPNGTITRAEFVALINRSSGFTEEAPIEFSDVASTNWAYKEVAKAVKIGYITGYTDGTFKPNTSISRQEVAVIVNKLLSLSATTTVATFTDFGSVASWAKDAVNAAVDNKILNGYAADNTFKPLNPMSRAEAVVTLDRANEPKAVVYDKAGTYGPLTGTEIVNKDVVINAPGVTLQNMTLNGKLLFAAGINSGDAFLKNVTVKGETTVQGGGVNSIHFENSILATVTVDKAAALGSVRIVAEGSTTVQQVNVKSPVTLQEINVTASGFGDVTLSEQLPAGSNVTLRGTFNNVIVVADQIKVALLEGSVKGFIASATATGLSLEVATGTTITTLYLDSVTKVTGKGSIITATLSPAVKATGLQTFETTPGTVDVGIFIPTPAPTATPTPTNGSNNGNGGGGGTSDTTAPTVTLTTPSAATYEPFVVTATFSEAVIGFNISDISVTNGAYANFSTVSNNVYQFVVTPTVANGVVSINIAGSVAQDWAGNNNTAATPLNVTYDTVKPIATVTSATYHETDTVLDAKSSEIGTIYLVVSSANIQTKASAEAAVSNGTARKVNVATANANTSIALTNLANGTYNLIAIDAAGNVSTKSTGIITIY